MPHRLPALACLLLAGACAPVSDARYAHRAQSELLGLSELDLATCMGAPLRRLKVAEAEILTFEQVSSSTMSVSVPLLGGMSVGGGGNCRANVRLDQGRVTSIRYTGETDTFFTRDSYCAPLVRDCLRHPVMYAAPGPGSEPRPAERFFGPAADRGAPPPPGTATGTLPDATRPGAFTAAVPGTPPGTPPGTTPGAGLPEARLPGGQP